MVTRFIPLFSPLRRAPWQLVYFHSTAVRASDAKSDGPEVTDVDMDRLYDDDEDDDGFDRDSDKLAPIDIDGYADEEENIQRTTEGETRAKKLYKLPKIPEKRSGVYHFEGIKITLPQRMLRRETFRYRVTERDFKLADDIRICVYDPVQPRPRWRIPTLSGEGVTTETMVKMMPNVPKVDYELKDNDAECELDVDRVMRDVKKNLLAYVAANCKAEQDFLVNNKNAEDLSPTAIADMLSRSPVAHAILDAAAISEDRKSRVIQNYVINAEEISRCNIPLGSLSSDTLPVKPRSPPLYKQASSVIKEKEKGNNAGDKTNQLQSKLNNLDANVAEDGKTGLHENPVAAIKRAKEFIQKWFAILMSK